MSPEAKTRLLASMRAGRLVVVCGAGLSMAPPSNVPSAYHLAELCFDEYELTVDANCDPKLRSDLEALAEHFADLGMLKTVFLEQIVPWEVFNVAANVGHAAIADFLITRVAVAGLTSNYDTLIESCGREFGFDFRGALDGDEANTQSAKQGPLLKFHGCSQRDRSSTVWARSQLQDAIISERIEKSVRWMVANLREKDLLVVGFWSDWQYLNQVISSALKDVNPLSITVVTPSETEQLKEKAPDLWALAQVENVSFEHVRESGADALDELRRGFSSNYIRQVLAAGRAAFEEETGEACDLEFLGVQDFDSETLYGWRRDAEGVPSSKPAIKRRPENCEALGLCHLLLRAAGAQQHTAGYTLNGRTIRVINGSGGLLGNLRTEFIEAPATIATDVVVAAGAVDLGVPGNVVRGGRQGDIVRPEASGAWFDLLGARAELDI